MSDFADRVVLVTGAASGIGRQVVTSLVAVGASVVGCDTAPSVVTDLAAVNAVGHRVDVTDEHQVKEMVTATCAQFGRIDALVTAAGIYRDGDILDATAAFAEELLRVNVIGTLIPARVVAASMIETDTAGAIVTVSSVAARLSTEQNGIYAATKGAVEALTRSLSVSLAHNGIRVNAVAPGPIDTPQATAALKDPEYATRMLDRISLGRLGTPLDIAEAVMFLCGPRSPWITGAVLAVDGGVTAKR